ncbi:MAG: SusC/RagA family TonB-linked outer membrane protein [Cyclobacteriaceae bacterium]|nr:SusC/RagA family TonB-linked outer membrane protein [Cyclobacteriaceae bacterium]
MKKVLLFGLSLLMATTMSFAQDRTVSGKVTSTDDGSTLPGVNVVVKGTTQGGVTDVDGNYKIMVPEGENTIVFSFIGLESKEVEIGNRSVINVEMNSDVQQLSEVVVTALGISREKASLGYSVQEVSGEDVQRTNEVNIVNALQGQVAGVQIQGSAGALGGSSRITIRGVNSLTGENQPLFVVDGVPIDNRNFATSSQQRGFGGGSYDYGNSASDINPADIESMTVLKGAAATAIYGSRGSNGVIVITTKKGAKGKGIGIEINSTLTFDNPYAMVDHQREYGGGAAYPTASGFNEFTQDGTSYLAPAYGKDGSWGPKYDPSVNVRHWDSWDPNSPNYKEVRPWAAPANDYKDFFETGVTRNNSISLSKANDTGSFRLGFTNVDQDGTLPNSNLKRNTITFSATQKLSDKLTASFSGSYVNASTTGRNVTGYDNKNPMQAFLQWYQVQLDTERLKDFTLADGTQQTWNAIGITKDGSGNLIDYNHAPNYFDNPYWIRERNLQEDVRNRFFGNIDLTYKITDNISVGGKIMRDGYSSQAFEGIAPGGVDQSEYREVTRHFSEMNYDARISYNKTINDISISVILGGNRMKQSYNSVFNETVGGLALAGFFNLNNSIQAPNLNTFASEKAINSVYFTGSFGYKNLLYLDVMARNDWSSALSKEDRSFLYPAVTASFVFSEVLDVSWLSLGKIRVGLGQAGNDSGPYQLDDVFTPITPNFGTSSRYSVPDTRNNPDLVNELTTEIEFGIEARFLDNRLGFDFTYYDRTTDDQIMSVASSATTGYSAKWVNAGAMRNSGIELMVDALVLDLSGFQWNVGLNMATYNNEVVSLADGIDEITMGGTWAADLRIVKGESYMGLYGQDWERHANGQPLVDEDGYPIAAADRTYLGSAIADFTGGVRNTFSWKGISLSALFDFQGGGIIHSTSLQWANYSGMTPETVTQGGVDIRAEGYLFEGVYDDGSANTKRIPAQEYFQGYWRVASPNVYDASFIKLREASLAYALPNKLIENWPIRDLRVSFFGRNLAILSSNLPYLDPQGVTGTGNRQGLENAQVPSTRSWGFNIGFKL